MTSKEVSGIIRSAFGAFFRGRRGKPDQPVLPPVLNQISINISHTFATRVRVRILKQIAKLHQAANTDHSVFVTNYLPRPQLKIRGPVGRPEAYTYVEAVKRFGHILPRDFLTAETTYAQTGLPVESLQSIFIVLSSDLTVPSILQTPQQPPAARGGPSVKRTASVAFKEVTHPRANKKKGKGKGKGKAVPAKIIPKDVPATSTTATVVPGPPPLTTSNKFDALGTPIQLDRSYVNDESSSSESERDATITEEQSPSV